MKLRLIGGGLLASAASLVVMHVGVARAADDDFHENGEGLHRPGLRAGHEVGRPDHGSEGAGQEAGRLRLRPTDATAARSGVGDGAQEAAKAIGWEFRILDGQGSVPGALSALAQAIALKPDGIILGSSTPPSRRRCRAGGRGGDQGRRLACRAPVPARSRPCRTSSPTSPPIPNEVAKASGLYAVVDSGGTAGVILFTDSIYAIATAKTNAEKAAVEGCKGARCCRSRTPRSATSPTAWAS